MRKCYRIEHPSNQIGPFQNFKIEDWHLSDEDIMLAEAHQNMPTPQNEKTEDIILFQGENFFKQVGHSSRYHHGYLTLEQLCKYIKPKVFSKLLECGFRFYIVETEQMCYSKHQACYYIRDVIKTDITDQLIINYNGE